MEQKGVPPAFWGNIGGNNGYTLDQKEDLRPLQWGDRVDGRFLENHLEPQWVALAPLSGHLGP